MPVQVDVLLDADGDLPEVTTLATGIPLIEQRIRMRLRRGTGEWFLDPNGTGLPLLDWRQQKPPRISEIVGRVQVEIREVPGVVSTANFVGVHDPAARRLTITGDVIVDDGSVTSVVVVGVEAAARNTMFFGVFFSGSKNIRGGIPRPNAGGS